MGTRTISDLPYTNITGSEVFPVVSDGTTYQASVANLSSVFLPLAGGQIDGSVTINSGGLTVLAGGVTATGNSTITGTLKASGNISGTATPTTTMTTGFVHIPKAAGPPTGVPTAITGYAPLYFDSTNNRLYVYNTTGGWKSTLLA